MVRPDRALAQPRPPRRGRRWGPYGYYEAIDYTPAASRRRPTAAAPREVVRSYMAHHQGMGLLALANVLDGNVFQERFHRDPLVRSVEILLQERVPTVVETHRPAPAGRHRGRAGRDRARRGARRGASAPQHASDPAPHAALLSNGRYSAIVTTSGTGYSRLRRHRRHALARRPHARRRRLLRLRPRRRERRAYWSAGAAARDARRRRRTATTCGSTLNKVESARVDDWIETFTETVVSPEDDVEVRRVTLTNYSDRPRDDRADELRRGGAAARPRPTCGHPAFSKLFVETEYLPRATTRCSPRAGRAPRATAPLARPRRRRQGLARADRSAITPLQYETDRMRFVGRGRTLDAPAALDRRRALSRTAGRRAGPRRVAARAS